MIVFYILLLIILSIYSYSLVDPNFTLINSHYWTLFRNTVVYFGYYQRFWSWIVYLILISALFLFYFYFVRQVKKYHPLTLALLIGGILLLSYPFLSHDFFNYLFDAKIVTYYFKNPYFTKALDFPNDPWIRFMHWTHRTYPYGPFFLLITLIPSFLSLGKLVLSFLLFKITWFIFYLSSVYLLNKLNKKWSMIFATHPLIIIEGLINAHNDLIGLCLAFIGIYYLSKNKNLLGRIILVFSAGIKYMTFPLVFLVKPQVHPRGEPQAQPHPGGVILVLVGLVMILGYLTFYAEIQPWYFLTLFAFLPYLEKFISRLEIFFIGLLLSYYPYIRFGGWDSLEKLQLKHIIILVFLVINVIYFVGTLFKNEKINKLHFQK